MTHRAPMRAKKGFGKVSGRWASGSVGHSIRDGCGEEVAEAFSYRALPGLARKRALTLQVPVEALPVRLQAHQRQMARAMASHLS